MHTHMCMYMYMYVPKHMCMYMYLNTKGTEKQFLKKQAYVHQRQTQQCQVAFHEASGMPPSLEFTRSYPLHPKDSAGALLVGKPFH